MNQQDNDAKLECLLVIGLFNEDDDEKDIHSVKVVSKAVERVVHDGDTLRSCDLSSE